MGGGDEGGLEGGEEGEAGDGRRARLWVSERAEAARLGVRPAGVESGLRRMKMESMKRCDLVAPWIDRGMACGRGFVTVYVNTKRPNVSFKKRERVL